MPLLSSLSSVILAGRTLHNITPVPDAALIDAVTSTAVSQFFTFPDGVSIGRWNRQQVLSFNSTATSTVLSKATTSVANNDYSFELTFNTGSLNGSSFVFNKPFLIAAGLPTPPYSMYAVTFGGLNLTFWNSFNYSGGTNNAGPLLNNTWYYLKVRQGVLQLYNISAGAWVYQNQSQLGGSLQPNSTFYLGGQPATYANNPQVNFDGQIAMARFSQPAITTVPTTVPNYTSADVTANDKIFIVRET